MSVILARMIILFGCTSIHYQSQGGESRQAKAPNLLRCKMDPGTVLPTTHKMMVTL